MPLSPFCWDSPDNPPKTIHISVPFVLKIPGGIPGQIMQN